MEVVYSRTTGWYYDDPATGSMANPMYETHRGAPGLIFIEGGTFTIGSTQDDVMGDWNNIPRQVTVYPFLIDEMEISNFDYLEYLWWLKKVYKNNGMEEVYLKALPDTNVWREKMSFNEPLVTSYLRHPSFRDHPVVGVSWRQVNDYCLWRSDRVNEMRLADRGMITINPKPSPDSIFTTDAYLAGKVNFYEAPPVKNKKGEVRNMSANRLTTAKASYEDGVLLPNYRLPTEAEWEYAAIGLAGSIAPSGMITSMSNYPWPGNQTRSDGVKRKDIWGNIIQDKVDIGMYMDNYNMGRGNSMGSIGNQNDGYPITAPVYTFFRNDFGLYHMAGNVSEWVMDTYRQLSFEDFSANNPFRGNEFKSISIDNDGTKQIDDSKRFVYKDVDTTNDPKILSRYNYRQSDYKNFNDGTERSLNSSENVIGSTESFTNKMYTFSLVNDNSRVYKGGSWRDGQYYLSPSVRRFYDMDGATNYLGFRCAMSIMGTGR